MEELKALAQKLWANILDKYNSILKSTEAKIAFWTGTAVVLILTGYVIALIGIGLRNGESSITGMVALYILDPEARFPFLGWLIASAVVMAVLCTLIHYFLNTEAGRNFKIANSDVYGNARDISKEELHSICEVESPELTDKPILALAPGSSTKVLGAIPDAMDNRNIAIIGTPGSGKSYTVCLPYIVQAIRRRESVIMTDTKGELWGKTVNFARDNGYIIRRFDLREPDKSDGWNVLKEMRHDPNRAQIFAETLVAQFPNISADFSGMAQNFLLALSLYVERNSDLPDSERNLATIYKMISLEAETLSKKFEAASKREEMIPAITPYNSFKGSSDNLKGNIINNVSAGMQILNSPDYRSMVSRDDIDLTLPGKVPCIYYVSMSDQDDTTRFLSSLFFAFLFRNLVDYADRQPGQKTAVPVTILFEEFAQVKLPKIAKQFSTVRSRGCGIIMILQTLDQLKKEYRDDWRTMLDECPIQICLAANGEEVSRYFSEKSGECTIEARTDQYNYWSLIQKGNYSTGYGKRPFRTPNEIRKIPKFNCLIVWQRFDTLVTRTFGINSHPAYEHMKESSAFTKVPASDTAARKYIRDYEDNRVQEMTQFIEQGGQPMWYVKTPPSHIKGPMTGERPPAYLPYEELEKEALAFSKANPDINQHCRQIAAEEKLNAARHVQDEISNKTGKDAQAPKVLTIPPGEFKIIVVRPNDAGDCEQSSVRSAATSVPAGTGVAFQLTEADLRGQEYRVPQKPKRKPGSKRKCGTSEMKSDPISDGIASDQDYD